MDKDATRSLVHVVLIMIEKLDEYRTSLDGTYMELVGVREVVDKINEIIDFLNDTYLMDVKDGKLSECGPAIEPMTFLNGISAADCCIDNMVHVESIRGNVKCPNCGESYYTIEYGESTCVYYPPIIKDGVNINPDRNTHTQHCRCLNCQTRFEI